MKRVLTSTLVLGLMAFPVVGLVGCGEETKHEVKETVSTPGGTTTSETTTKVKSTGENPPPNAAGETAKTAK
jgi:hypothetical protein